LDIRPNMGGPCGLCTIPSFELRRDYDNLKSDLDLDRTRQDGYGNYKYNRYLVSYL
jgi:hypothetical protein